MFWPMWTSYLGTACLGIHTCNILPNPTKTTEGKVWDGKESVYLADRLWYTIMEGCQGRHRVIFEVGNQRQELKQKPRRSATCVLPMT